LHEIAGSTPATQRYKVHSEITTPHGAIGSQKGEWLTDRTPGSGLDVNLPVYYNNRSLLVLYLIVCQNEIYCDPSNPSWKEETGGPFAYLRKMFLSGQIKS